MAFCENRCLTTAKRSIDLYASHAQILPQVWRVDKKAYPINGTFRFHINATAARNPASTGPSRCRNNSKHHRPRLPMLAPFALDAFPSNDLTVCCLARCPPPR